MRSCVRASWRLRGRPRSSSGRLATAGWGSRALGLAGPLTKLRLGMPAFHSHLISSGSCASAFAPPFNWADQLG